MALGRKGKVRSGKGGGGALLAHHAFAPLVGLWGALIGALVVMVMSSEVVDRLAAGTLIASFEFNHQAALAAASATMLGGLCYVLAAAASAAARRARPRHATPRSVARKVRPIDPLRDLGTASLDDPIETMPFATPAWRDAECEVSVQADVAEPAIIRPLELEPDAAGNGPLELDLAQVAALEEPNAAWVEEPAQVAPAGALDPAPAPEVSARAGRAAAIPPPGSAALTRLRAVPPSELSMLELVERFAGALHEHRATRARTLEPADLASREAALAEALKALAALSEGLAAPAQAAAAGEQAHLREALAQLRPRRGTV